MKIKKILLAEGESVILDKLYTALNKAEYTVDVALSADAGQRLFINNSYDLVLTDERLPDANGCEFCSFIRRRDNIIPVVMISFGFSDDRMEGFRSGVDDFVLLSDDLRELLLRIKALERRCLRSVESNPILRAADISINLESKEVWRCDKLIQLSAKEFMLLQLLVSNKNRVVSIDEIARVIWGIEISSKQNRVAAFITSLRKKIGDNVPPGCIYTVTSKGYVIYEKKSQDTFCFTSL